MKSLSELPVKIYADGADHAGMVELYQTPYIKGLTTNPTLMRAAGISDYETFAHDVLKVVKTKPISFEVFSDDFAEMHRQALKISGWQDNVFVKIPVTNTHGESSAPLVAKLARAGVRLNVTALLTTAQVELIAAQLNPEVPAIVSIFAGRIADTGLDPVPIMRASRDILRPLPHAELLWASVREVLNIYQAAACGTDIVTVGHAILAKAIQLCGRDLEALSIDTIRMFHADAEVAGYKL